MCDSSNIVVRIIQKMDCTKSNFDVLIRSMLSSCSLSYNRGSDLHEADQTSFFQGLVLLSLMLPAGSLVSSALILRTIASNFLRVPVHQINDATQRLSHIHNNHFLNADMHGCLHCTSNANCLDTVGTIQSFILSPAASIPCTAGKVRLGPAASMTRR
jgi:hypothetical protein